MLILVPLYSLTVLYLRPFIHSLLKPLLLSKMLTIYIIIIIIMVIFKCYFSGELVALS